MTKAAQYEKEGVFVPLIDNFSKVGSSCMSYNSSWSNSCSMKISKKMETIINRTLKALGVIKRVEKISFGENFPVR